MTCNPVRSKVFDLLCLSHSLYLLDEATKETIAPFDLHRYFGAMQVPYVQQGKLRPAKLRKVLEGVKAPGVLSVVSIKASMTNSQASERAGGRAILGS